MLFFQHTDGFLQMLYDYCSKFVESNLMELKFIKNIQFTKLIKVDGRLKEFNFRKPNGRQEGLFTVDVIDERGNRIIFNMEKTGEQWKIITPNLPIWITATEEIFNSLIEEEFKLIN